MKKLYFFSAALLFCSALFFIVDFDNQPFLEPADEYEDITPHSASVKLDVSENRSFSKVFPNNTFQMDEIENCLSAHFQVTQSYREKEFVFTNLLISLKRDNTPFWLQQRAAIALGFNPDEARSMIWVNVQYLDNINYQRLFTDARTSIKRGDYRMATPEPVTGSFDTYFEHMNQLFTLIEIADYRGLVAYIAEHQLSYKTIYSEDLLSTIFLLHPDIAVHDVSYLLNNGISLSLKSLVLLSELNNGLAIAQEVVNAEPEFQYDIEWQSGYFYINLTLDAIQRGQFDLASFWLANDVKAHINTGERNALDYFPEPSEQQYESALTLLKQLRDLNVQPNFPKTLQRIRGWLRPEDRHLLDGMTMSWSIDELLTKELKLKEVKQQFDEISISVAVQYKELAHCINSEKIQEQLPVKALANEVHDVPRQLSTQEALQSRKAQFLKITEMTQEERRKPQFLGSDKSLEELRKGEQKDPPKKNPWRGLGYKSWKQITALLERGEKLPESAILSLAATGKIEYIEKLIPYGLNLYYANEQGENALIFALESRDSLETIRYLLNLGVPIALSDVLLHKAIRLSAIKSEIVDVISLLMERGVTPKAEHLRTFVYSVSGNDSNYAKLKALLISNDR